MLVAPLEPEVATYVNAHRAERDEDGHALVVRNGQGRVRKVTRVVNRALALAPGRSLVTGLEPRGRGIR